MKDNENKINNLRNTIFMIYNSKILNLKKTLIFTLISIPIGAIKNSHDQLLLDCISLNVPDNDIYTRNGNPPPAGLSHMSQTLRLKHLLNQLM